jgi:arginine decarboxylase
MVLDGRLVIQDLQFVPRKAFFVKGKGVHREKLNSFELALREHMTPGQITFCVLSQNSTNEPSRLISAGIGLARPRDPGQYGYISEHHGFGQTARKVADYSEDLAATMLATVLGVKFDPDKNYDERKEIYRMSGQIVDSRSIVQTAEGHKDGLWTSVLAAVVFVV